MPYLDYKTSAFNRSECKCLLPLQNTKLNTSCSPLSSLDLVTWSGNKMNSLRFYILWIQYFTVSVFMQYNCLLIRSLFCNPIPPPGMFRGPVGSLFCKLSVFLKLYVMFLNLSALKLCRSVNGILIITLESFFSVQSSLMAI